jgi:zinc and cadmium transporter
MLESNLMVLIGGLILLLPSLVGGAFWIFGLQAKLEHNTHQLLAFALGVYAVVTYSMAEEMYHHGDPILMTVVAAGIFGALELSRRFFQKHHHHHSETDHDHSKNDADSILAADGVHNVTDGIVIVPAFAINPVIGFATTAGIFFHEVILESAKYIILREAGYTQRQALLRSFLAATTVFIGIFLALFLSNTESFEPFFFAIATGAVLHVVLRDLFPDVFLHEHNRTSLVKSIIAAVLGAMVLLSVQWLLPHEHELGDTHDEHLEMNIHTEGTH